MARIETEAAMRELKKTLFEFSHEFLELISDGLFHLSKNFSEGKDFEHLEKALVCLLTKNVNDPIQVEKILSDWEKIKNQYFSVINSLVEEEVFPNFQQCVRYVSYIFYNAIDATLGGNIGSNSISSQRNRRLH